ncbi:hypothetical protein [Sorangium sp. So ce1000]|uniref:hypothetical protein n=1 Tax=Sorangium sp. So ce1000 TaxID=3133325 RepID=UPI003F62B4FE
MNTTLQERARAAGPAPSRRHFIAWCLAVLAGAAVLFSLIHRYAADYPLALDITKGAIASSAVLGLLYEARRGRQRRPIAERWKKRAAFGVSAVAVVAYFEGFHFAYPSFYHRWEHYHYYLGAKYFPEMAYDDLYKCTVIAQDELGVVAYTDERTGQPITIDMSAEVREPDKKIRNLGVDNLLISVGGLLEHPETCKAHFSPERWGAFKADVRFFRTASEKGYWEDMAKDHGYNPPPVWTIMGRILAELHPATTGYLQLLASFDIAYLFGVFAALYWAFGWRVCAVAVIFWACQSPAPFFWTGGGFLRHDWLFFLVLSACLLRKKHFKLAGASMVYAGLLRVFPGIAVIGWLTVAGSYLFRHKRMAPSHVQVLIGGVLAAAVLIPVSIAVAGKDSYQQFYEHTLKVHDKTPVTNHMGLRVLVAHRFGTGVESGRMKYTKDITLADPFEVWKRMRSERYEEHRGVAYALIAASFAIFVHVARRVRSLWVGQCLAQVFIILLSQITCYYYVFMILSAPLTRSRRRLEVPLLGLAALSQGIWRWSSWNDDRYTVLTVAMLAFCYFLLYTFARKARRGRARVVDGPRAPSQRFPTS